MLLYLNVFVCTQQLGKGFWFISQNLSEIFCLYIKFIIKPDWDAGVIFAFCQLFGFNFQISKYKCGPRTIQNCFDFLSLICLLYYKPRFIDYIEALARVSNKPKKSSHPMFQQTKMCKMQRQLSSRRVHARLHKTTTQHQESFKKKHYSYRYSHTNQSNTAHGSNCS